MPESLECFTVSPSNAIIALELYDGHPSSIGRVATVREIKLNVELNVVKSCGRYPLSFHWRNGGRAVVSGRLD
jgi:hypothetical protein